MSSIKRPGTDGESLPLAVLCLSAEYWQEWVTGRKDSGKRNDGEEGRMHVLRKEWPQNKQRDKKKADDTEI